MTRAKFGDENSGWPWVRRCEKCLAQHEIQILKSKETNINNRKDSYLSTSSPSRKKQGSEFMAYRAQKMFYTEKRRK